MLTEIYRGNKILFRAVILLHIFLFVNVCGSFVNFVLIVKIEMGKIYYLNAILTIMIYTNLISRDTCKIERTY